MKAGDYIELVNGATTLIDSTTPGGYIHGKVGHNECVWNPEGKLFQGINGVERDEYNIKEVYATAKPPQVKVSHGNTSVEVLPPK